MTGSKGGVAAKLGKYQSLKHFLNVYNIHHRLSLACADSSNQLNFLKEFELTLTQLWVFSNNSPKRPNVYLKTAHKMHNMKTLPDSKRKNLVKKVKKTFNTRCIRLHFSMLNFENILTNTTSSEFSVYGHSKINVLSNHFFCQSERK